MKKEIKINEVEVYRAYLKAKGTKGYSVTKLSKKLGIPRATLYVIVNKIEKGDEKQLNRCTEQSKYDCIWKYRYERLFFVIEEEHGETYSEQIKTLIYEMKCDGFGIREIARRIGKDASTVKYHLKSYDY